MKTIKVRMIKGEIDTSSFNQNKFPNREDVIQKIAQKLKKPISEIRKNKSIIDVVYNKMLHEFFNTKIIKDNAHLIASMINYNKLSKRDKEYINNGSSFNGWHIIQKCDLNKKTIIVNLCYKNRINYEIANKHEFITNWKNIQNGFQKLSDGSTKKLNKSQLSYYNRLWNENRYYELISKLENDIISGLPKFVQHWTTKDGKREIEFIEKRLQDIGKIKIEIHNGKNKKLYTFYITYKKTNTTFKMSNEVKKLYGLV